MSLNLHWLGDDQLDRIIQTRLRCYGTGENQLDRIAERTRNDPRAAPGDYLLAEHNGEAVGTATSLSLTMWVRGSALPCQGVAWVGAVKTMRRRNFSSAAGAGVASSVMTEVLNKARQREQVVSALMPFRGSFYEHFGYGFVERRCDWTLPMAVLPTGPFDGIRFYEPADFAARADCLRRVNHAGQCAVERSDAHWHARDREAWEGFQIVDRPQPDGPAHGSMTLLHSSANGKDVLKVYEMVYQDLPALRRQLHFLASLRDQYASADLQSPADLPLNWLLKEVQIPHRLVNHPVAQARPFTRLQLRVLDHGRFLEALHLPSDCTPGVAVVAVRESEGYVSRFRVEIEAGRASSAASDAAADFELPAPVWAAVATGDMSAGQALRLGLATGSDHAAAVLQALAHGPAPFCHEYF